jgi:hypothetical protein
MPRPCFRHHVNGMRVEPYGLPWCIAWCADAAATVLATGPRCRGVEVIR